MDAKRFAWVILIFAGGLLLLTLYARSKRPEPAEPNQAPPASGPSQPAEPATAPASGPTTQPAPAGPAATAPAASAPAAARQREEFVFLRGRPGKFHIGSLDPRGPYALQVELTSEGAAIYTVKLARHFTTVEDKQLALSDPEAYEAARRDDPETYQGHYSLMNPVAFGEQTYLPLATRSIAVSPAGRDRPARIRLDDKAWQIDPNTPQTAADGTQTIRFTWLLYRDASFDRPDQPPDRRPFLKLIKTYQVRKDSFSLAASLALENLSSAPLKVAVDQAGPTGVPREDFRGDRRRAVYGVYLSEDKKVQPRTKETKVLKDWPLGEVQGLGSTEEKDARLWLGQVNKYFGSMMYLLPPGSQEQALAAPSYQAGFYALAAKEGLGSLTFVTGMTFPAITLEPNQAQRLSFDVFAGPKMQSLFQDTPLYKKLNYRGTIDLGGCWCAWDELTLGMMWLLGKLYWVAFHNYGLAIILLVILVRVVLYPVSRKSQVSMVKMQKLAPQIQKLKEKYADDKAALSRETMQVYKQAGATPLLGCLPMILQMPIWVALWTALNATVELRHAGLLPVWITDLAAPDALLKWHEKIWLIGNSFNLLPILSAIAIYLQSRFTAPMTQASPEQEKSQRMMRVMMPVMMLFVLYTAPSGLTLYIAASTFVGVVEHRVIRKHIERREEIEAARETTIEVPGKGPRSSRPKKPRGPFWIKGK